MNSADNTSEEILVLCANCAWREVCIKRFSFDNTKAIKCPDFSPDVRLLKEKRVKKVDKEEDKSSS